MKRASMFCLLAIGLGCISSCGLISALTLGRDLVRAIRNAPPGEEICAVFDVIEQETDGRRVSSLVNSAARILGSPIRITSAHGDAIVRLTRIVSCQFISCAVSEIKSLDPPYEDPNLPQWVRERVTVINNLIQTCPDPVTLDEDTLLGLIYFIGALEL